MTRFQKGTVTFNLKVLSEKFRHEKIFSVRQLDTYYHYFWSKLIANVQRKK